MSSLLPPDQSLSISHINERLIILSVSEQGLKIGQGTDYVDFTQAGYRNGVYLYTENLSITSNISGTYGLTISTFSLQCAQKAVIVNANGSKGAKSVDGKGGDGGDGGVLSVFVQDLSDVTAKTLELQARGGDGGVTDSSNGSGGNGGNGGTVNSVFQSTYVQLLPVLDRYFNQQEFHPEGTGDEVTAAYSTPVYLGDSLYQDAKTAISAAQVLSVEEGVIDNIFQLLSKEISKIDNGGTSTVLLIKIGVNSARNNLQHLIANQQGDVATMDSNVEGGNPGIGENVSVEPGLSGKNGYQTQVFLSTWGARNFADAPFPIAHPVHCSMLLERANTFFYMNSPSLRAYARLLYQRVIDRLSFLPLSPEDPLYQAYINSPIGMPSTTMADLDNTKTQASNLLVQLNAGALDYNGYRALWVPRASYTFYSGVMENALNDFAIFEDAYTKYQEAFQKQQDLNDKLSIAYNNTSGILTSLAEDQEDLDLSIQDLDRKISNATPVVEKARGELIEAYEAEIEVIKSSFGLSVPQIVNALTSIAFSPNEFMGGLQAGNLIYQGFTSVPTVDGLTVNKDYLASEIKQGEASIDSIKTLLGSKIDGEYQLDDPFGTRLITEESMLSTLGQFSQGAFGGVDDEEARKNLEDKFDALIDAVTTRNGFILDYNVTINLLLSKIGQAADYKQKQQELVHKQVTYNDPDLSAITAYVGAIYQSSRSRVMKLIDTLLRSLNFRMVITSDVYNYAFPSGDPDNQADLDEVPLSLTSAVLRNVRSNIVDKFTQQVEFWGSEPAKFPRDFDIDEGKQFRLKSFDLEELLEDDEHTIVITIPNVDKFSTNAGDFEGCCNIRLYRVRFVLTGLKADPGKIARVEFTLMHGGNETIYNRSNAAYKFEHDPVTTIFSFRVDDKGTRSILDNGNIGESDINEVATSYAAPGPFAEWTISMKGTEWESLDTSGVTGGYFDFCGTNYAFN